MLTGGEPIPIWLRVKGYTTVSEARSQAGRVPGRLCGEREQRVVGRMQEITC